MKRALLWSVVISLTTVGALAGAVLLANFGASRWIFVALLGVPLTIGLPSTLGVLLCVALWQGPPLWGFGAAAVALAIILQWSGFWLARLIWRRRRR